MGVDVCVCACGGSACRGLLMVVGLWWFSRGGMVVVGAHGGMLGGVCS